MLLEKIVLLIWYSYKYIIFEKIKLIFDLENWLKTENAQLIIISVYEISKFPLSLLIYMQKSH